MTDPPYKTVYNEFLGISENVYNDPTDFLRYLAELTANQNLLALADQGVGAYVTSWTRTIEGASVTDLIKDKLALKRLADRIKNCPPQHDNSAAHAGAPMFFYCKICGHQSDCLPESYTSRPVQYCDECYALKKVNPDITDKTFVELATTSDVTP